MFDIFRAIMTLTFVCDDDVDHTKMRRTVFSSRNDGVDGLKLLIISRGLETYFGI